MSEFIGTRCDACGRHENVEPAWAVEEMGWVEGDHADHACPNCQSSEDPPDAEGLKAFGELVGAEADRIIESPEAVKLRTEREAAFKEIKENMFEAIRSDMTLNGFSKKDIKKALKETEEELDRTYNEKFGLKLGV